MTGVTAFAMRELFPDKDAGLTPENLSELQAKRYLDIGEGFYLATAIDARFAVWRFTWQDETYFTMRPDFFIRSLVKDLDEPPVNELERAIRSRLINNYRELEALKFAIIKGEIDAAEIYPIEWWIEFWRVRGISVMTQVCGATVSASGGEKPLKTTERDTLLTIIAALCNYSAIKHDVRGAANQIAKLTEELGAMVSEDTVRRALGKIPAALESRMK